MKDKSNWVYSSVSVSPREDDSSPNKSISNFHDYCLNYTCKELRELFKLRLAWRVFIYNLKELKQGSNVGESSGFDIRKGRW